LARSAASTAPRSTLLDVLDRLVKKALKSSSNTAPVVFRIVDAHQPTLLIDEADTFLLGDDALRGILNDGHRRGGRSLRCIGDDAEVRAFATYAAVAIALIVKKRRAAATGWAAHCAEDNWRALLAIAEVAGGHWPERARTAAVALASGNDDDTSDGATLLADIKAIFVERGVDRLSSKDLVDALCDL
jgi:hypothetical protein